MIEDIVCKRPDYLGPALSPFALAVWLEQVTQPQASHADL
jgi:hypothetical protein